MFATGCSILKKKYFQPSSAVSSIFYFKKKAIFYFCGHHKENYNGQILMVYTFLSYKNLTRPNNIARYSTLDLHVCILIVNQYTQTKNMIYFRSLSPKFSSPTNLFMHSLSSSRVTTPLWFTSAALKATPGERPSFSITLSSFLIH